MNSARRGKLVRAALAFLVLCLGIVPAAGHAPRPQNEPPAPYAAPEFPSGETQQTGDTWINSPPLTLKGLRGKVVLIDFWEYTCINCIRTFAQNKTWYQRYKKYGLEIIGVHAPEFDIAYPVENVRAATTRFGLPYPVVADHYFNIWKAFNNNSWPSRFVIDARGRVRFHVDGEGYDDVFERWFQRLLIEAHPGLKFPDTYMIEPDEPTFTPSCGLSTREMYVGDWFQEGALANREGYHDGKTITYKLPEKVRDGRAAVGGPWEADKNGMIYRGKQTVPGGPDRLLMHYTARELYSVLNVSRGKPSRLYIQQDGKDLTAAEKGVDVKFDAQGHTYLEIREARMYYLVQNAAFGMHNVTLIPTAPGLTVNSFTFGNDCQVKFPHL